MDGDGTTDSIGAVMGLDDEVSAVPCNAQGAVVHGGAAVLGERPLSQRPPGYARLLTQGNFSQRAISRLSSEHGTSAEIRREEKCEQGSIRGHLWLKKGTTSRPTASQDGRRLC